MSWKAGDRARLVDGGGVIGAKNLAVLGEECTLLCWSPSDDKWVIDIAGDNNWVADESCLRPIKGDDTDNCYQKTKWKDCEWQPSELVTLFRTDCA